MRTLTIDIVDVGGQPRDGDYVLLQAPRLRGSAERAGAVVMTSPVRVPLRAGKASVSVEPGPMLVHIRSRSLRDSAPFEVEVPSGSGPVTLRACMERRFRYQPMVESAVARNADRAHDALQGAVSAERKATAKANEAVERVDAAVNRGAELVRDLVRSDADRAQSKASEAVAAASSANKAASDAAAAQTSAIGAAKTASTAMAALSAAKDELTRAASSAASDADRAQSKAEEARESASTSSSYRDSAENSSDKAGLYSLEAQGWAKEAERSAAAAKVGAPVGGWEESTLHADVRAKIAKLDRINELGSSGPSVGALPHTVAIRSGEGALFVSQTPTRDEHAASKKYVDDLRFRRQTIFTSTAPTSGAGENMALSFARVHGTVNYSGNRFFLGSGIWRITVSAKRNEQVLQEAGPVKVNVFSEAGKWLAASDAPARGLLSSTSVVVDTRGFAGAFATALIDSKRAGTHLIVLVEDLTR